MASPTTPHSSSNACASEKREGGLRASDSDVKPAHLRYVPKLFPGSSHFWALEQAQKISTQSRVLDFGAGSGVIGNALKNEGWPNLFAVEVDPQATQAIASTYQRIENSLHRFGSDTFDLIFILDVLEHLSDPVEMLKELGQHLSLNGTLLVSVPNIAHWSTRFALLFGTFRYTDRGILDRTHLQFFTRKRIIEMITATSGLRVEAAAASIEPIELILPSGLVNNALFRLLSKCRSKLAQLVPGLMAYQHLIVVKKIG